MASALTGPIAAFNESLTSIFFQFIEEGVWNVGSWSGPLIDGFVAPKVTPEQVNATFGEPEAIGCGSPWTRAPSSSARTSTATCAPPPAAEISQYDVEMMEDTAIRGH